jgi:hypothetical protein
MTLAALGVFMLAVSTRRARRWAFAVLGGASLLEALPMVRLTSDAFYSPSPIVLALRNSGVGLSGGSFARQLSRTPPGAEELTYLAAAGGGGGGAYGSLFGLPELGVYAPGSSWRFWRFFAHPWTPAQSLELAGVLGVSHLVVDLPDEALPPRRVVARDSVHGLSVLAVTPSLPRAYAVQRAIPVPTMEAAFDYLGSSAFKPGREITLEGAVSGSEAQRPSSPAIPVAVPSEHPNDSLELDVELPWSGFVVLNESAFVGWSVEVDGQPQLIRVANGLVRAVEVPAGKHHVAFRYRTPGLAGGALLSALTLAALLGWARWS